MNKETREKMIASAKATHSELFEAMVMEIEDVYRDTLEWATARDASDSARAWGCGAASALKDTIDMFRNNYLEE